MGDPNQAIYGSLGGYPITIEELRHITDMEIEEFTLNFNYRSSSKIIDYYQCFKVFDSNIIPKGHNKEYPSVVRYNKDINSERIVDEIASKVVASVDDHNISPDQICIIAPQWFYLASITRKLASKLPMYKFNGPGLSPIARDVENFWYKLSRIALTDPSPQMYMRRMRWAKEILEELSECGVCLDEINERKFLRCCNTLNIMHANGLEYLQDFFDKALSACNIDIAECQYLLHKNEYFFESSKLRIERLQKENIEGADSIEYFKSFFDANKGINVSTIHGVKGGEYDVVIAFGLLDGMVPHFTEKEKDLSSKKLLYVIGSRARKYLYLYSETGRKRKFGFYSPTEVLKKTHYEYN
ncbi:3'-5' exonuclease [Cobetia crustatorum]|uniref:3'-5' exonuclease n=1 Tax=Cobetia crustatorum TaxID=553385 RepID=UPI0004B6C752|nr:3'-5' exonuclease [Cobetia crustatorum]